MPEEAETKGAQKRKVGRSPAYPNLNVQKALEKAKALYDQEGDYPAPLSSATTAWNYSAKSSGARQTLATLKYYGLIDVTGDGDARKVKVSDVARRILLDQREDQTEKKQLIRKVALTPAIHKTLYDQYGSGLASDGSVIHFLVFEEGYNQAAAAELLAGFKDTAKFVGLYDPSREVDKVSGGKDNISSEEQSPEIVIGSRIQWTSQGVDRFPKGAMVVGFSEDGQWVFTDQGSSGVPIGEVSLINAAPINTLPQMPAHMAKAFAEKLKSETEQGVKPGSRKAIFPVDDGDVTLIFPEDISADGLEELGQYISIFLNREHKKRHREG